MRGAFDVLHYGHVRGFRYAKTLGDVLVVSLDSDEVVAARKPGRPIFKADVRREVLEHLKPVDYVVVSAVDGAYDVLHALAPDILVVKAISDTPEGNAGARDALEAFCKERRIKIVVHQLPSGYSSTKILERLDA